MTVKGLSTFVTNYIKAELDTRNLLISLTVPKINIWGNYQVQGNVFLLNVEGNGPFQVHDQYNLYRINLGRAR